MRNKLLTRILAGVTAFALVAAGFTAMGAKKVTAADAADGSATFADSSWWTEYAVSRADLIGDVDASAIESITFYSTTTFCVGYNTVSGWAQPATHETEFVFDDIDLIETNYALKLFLSKGDGVNYTINWTLNMKEEEAKPFSNSATFSDQNWWTELAVTKADLVGDTDTTNGVTVTFTSDTTFCVGYNTVSGWAQPATHETEFVFTDIDMDDTNYALKLFLSKGDGVDYTISWTVVPNEASADDEEEEETFAPAPNPPVVEEEEDDDSTETSAVEDEVDDATDDVVDDVIDDVVEDEIETNPQKVAVAKVPVKETQTTTTHIEKDITVPVGVQMDHKSNSGKLYQIKLDDYAAQGLTINKITANFGGDGAVKAFYDANYWFKASVSVGYNKTGDAWGQIDNEVEATDAFSYSVVPEGINVAEGNIIQIGLWWAATDTVKLDNVVLAVSGDVTETKEVIVGYKYYLVNEDGTYGDEITEEEYNAIAKKNAEVEADTDVTTGSSDMVSVWMILAFVGAAVAATVFGFSFKKREQN